MKMLIHDELVDKTLNDLTDDIYHLLSSNGLDDIICEPFENGVKIFIEWGNWKEDHFKAKNLIESAGYNYGYRLDVDADDDFPDCYSAYHYVFA